MSRISLQIAFSALLWTNSAALRAAEPFVAAVDGLTVYDSANGITWLSDLNLPASNRFGLPVCTASSLRSETCVNATGSMNYANAAAWVAAMNAANYLGHNNWQMPTIPLNDARCGRTGPNGQNFGYGCTAGALDSLYNALGFVSPATAVPVPANTVGPFSNIQPYLYWSSGTNPNNLTAGNLTFAFSTGWQGANTLANFLYLWPMIPGKLAGTPANTGNGLQVNPGGQTVYDPITNITWLANANIAASNAFGLPACTSPTAPAVCVDADGAMPYAATVQLIANMNAAGYLGQTKWQAPTIDSSCPGYGCTGTLNPMGNLFYTQLGLSQGASAVPPLTAPTGPFHNLQPYLYWSCVGATIQSACAAAGPADNFEESYSFGSGFQGTDLVANDLNVTAYFVGNRASTAGPVISEASNAASEIPILAPNTWVDLKGAGLAPAGDARIWVAADFVGSQMPTQLDHVSATVNGKNAYVYYISPSQVNILTPPDLAPGPAQVIVSNNGATAAAFTAQVQAISPSFFLFNGGPYVAAVHSNGALIGPTTLYPGSTTPAKPGEIIQLYGNGFGPTSVPVAGGSTVQMGTLAPLPAISIGGVTATVQFAGLVAPGEFQFNVVVPGGLSNGDQAVTASYGGQSAQPGTLITVHN